MGENGLSGFVLQFIAKIFAMNLKKSFQDLKELFNRIDADASNDLNLQEVHIFFKSITDDISDENIDRIFNNLDSNGDKSIDFNEFTVKIEVCKSTKIFLLLPQNLFNEISVAG